MDTLIVVATIIVATLCTGLTGWLILHPRVHEGLLIKTGLIIISTGSYAMAWQVRALDDAQVQAAMPILRAMVVCAAGTGLVLAGIAWRLHRVPGVREAWRTASGWTPLDEQPGDTR